LAGWQWPRPQYLDTEEGHRQSTVLPLQSSKAAAGEISGTSALVEFPVAGNGRNESKPLSADAWDESLEEE